MTTAETLSLLCLGALIGGAVVMLIEAYTSPRRRARRHRRYVERVLQRSRLAHWEEQAKHPKDFQATHEH